jgi:hypothetical protein
LEANIGGPAPTVRDPSHTSFEEALDPNREIAHAFESKRSLGVRRHVEAPQYVTVTVMVSL